jgi:signal transduction histidine kinase
MYLNPYAKVYFEKQMGIRSVDFGSVYLFINGFRIPPYGDIDNDSFGMEVRKTQGRSRYISNREVIGRIEIEDRNGDFKIISSREGIVQDEFYKQLIHKSTKSSKVQTKNNGFFYKTLRRLEKYVTLGLSWDSVPKEYTESKIKELISSSNWNQSKEIYKISYEDKLKKIANNIFKYISLDYNSIVDFYISEEILFSLLEKNALQTQKNITLFLKEFSKIPSYAIDKSTKKNIKKIFTKVDDELLRHKINVVLNKNPKIDKLIDKEFYYKELDAKIKVLEDVNTKLKKQKEQSEKQANRLKKILSKDIKDLVAFQHHIGLYAITAKNYVLDTIDEIQKNNFNKDEYLDNLQNVIFELERIKIISRYISREDYLSTEKKVNDNLVNFIQNYIKNIYESSTNREFNITVNTNNIEFKCKYEPININIIIDNLLSNSKKEEINAKNVTINFYKEENSLLMEYIDDGKGLSPDIVDKDTIFDIGVTTTSGSGIGMYHIKELLDEMNSTIEVKKLPKGIKFLIRFNLWN